MPTLRYCQPCADFDVSEFVLRGDRPYAAANSRRWRRSRCAPTYASLVRDSPDCRPHCILRGRAKASCCSNPNVSAGALPAATADNSTAASARTSIGSKRDSAQPARVVCGTSAKTAKHLVKRLIDGLGDRLRSDTGHCQPLRTSARYVADYHALADKLATRVRSSGNRKARRAANRGTCWVPMRTTAATSIGTPRTCTR